MDFSFTTAHPAPVPVTINGTTYQVPRVLLPEFKAIVAEKRAELIKAATAHLDKLEKARFLTYYAPPPVDTSDMARQMLTPDGVDALLRRQFKAASIPDAEADTLLSQADPVELRNLAEEISSAQRAATAQAESSGDGEGTPESPPSADGGPTPTSADSDTITSAT